jgi:predicted dehydrogenase/type 1 glutamine amidotransferase
VISVLAYLSGRGRDRDHALAAEPLLRLLDRAGGFEVDVVTDASRLADLGHHRVVFAATDDGPLGAEEEQALAGWVRQGGGLVAAHGTLAAWRENRLIRDLAGFAPGERTQTTQLAVRPAGPHPVVDRLDEEFSVTADLHLPSDGLPPDAVRLLTVPWRYSEQVAASVRPVGDGLFLYVGIGGGAAAYASPAFLQFLYRSIRFGAGPTAPRVFGMGLAGYGAIARDHGRQLREVAGLELRGVSDLAPGRRAQAEGDFGVPVHDTVEGMLADPAVEVVVVGTPPNTHAEIVLSALSAGKHVVCEKPFAIRLADVDRMLQAAQEVDRALTVYQSRRWDPDFVALRQTVESGSIGEPFHLESFIGGYGHPCNYWHTHEPISGGTIFDWGSHYIDWTLLLFKARVATVSAVAQDRVWQDVTNSDHVNVDLRFADGTQASFLHSDVATAMKPKWYLLATSGGVVGDWRRETVMTRGSMDELVEDALAPADSPARLTVFRPNGEGGVNQELLALPRRVRNGFYRNLADHLLLGEPLAVPAGEARRNIAVMEAATHSIAQGGRSVRLDV